MSKAYKKQWLPAIPESASHEEYVRLCMEQVCQACGMQRVHGGGDEYDYQDPCIANLPGVIAACCGHGTWQSYALFKDGRVLRGKFDHLTLPRAPSPDRKEYLRLKAAERRAATKLGLTVSEFRKLEGPTS